jgi:ParB family chromosome partitioning protein
MAKKRGLGRGLSSLIPDTGLSADDDSGLVQVAIDAINPNPRQPREKIDPDQLEELANSIKEHGLIQPLVVRKVDGGQYNIIAGERRWRAARMAGLGTIPVVIKEASPQAMLELALVENIQRADLNAVEEAQAYQQLMDEFDLTQKDVSKRVGKSRSTVANMVRLLSLPQVIQIAVMDGKLSGAHARALLPLSKPKIQENVMAIVIEKGLTVRQVEDLVRKMVTGSKEGAGQSSSKPQMKRSPEIDALEADIRQTLGTKVKIQKGPKGGKVVIHFFSDEELQSIYEAIVHDQ